MQMKKYVPQVGASLGVAASLVSLGASAQTATATDFSSILAGLSASTAITAILGAGLIVAGVGFARWGVRKVAGFFR